MNYEREILARLIEKYEKSKAYTTGIFTRRIALSIPAERWLQERMEAPDEKKELFCTLAQMKREGLIDYSWQKFEKGNLLEKIWLVPDEGAIRNSYKRLGRKPAREGAKALCEMMGAYEKQLDPESAFYHFLEDYRDELKEKGHIRRFFTDDMECNEAILKCLVYMDGNQDEQMERLMSSALYKDSKYFEKNVRAKVLSILRFLKRKGNEEVPEDEELLREQGIVRWPEVFEFTGPLTVELTDGSRIDFSAQRYGAYINSETAKRIKRIHPRCVHRVMFIENKANYVWYIAHERAEDELAVFHGGCYSPMKGRWFKKLYEGCRDQKEPVKYRHWSDIDLGGFRIFHRLKKQIVPELAPWRMDRETLLAFQDEAMPIDSEAYLESLKLLEADPEYECFKEVILQMTEDRIRLEQEKIIDRYIKEQHNEQDQDRKKE